MSITTLKYTILLAKKYDMMYKEKQKKIITANL